MNDPSIRNPAYLSLNDQQLSEIDALCDRFDQALVKGDGPRIEAFLVEVPEAARDGLLAELLAMENEYRSEQGDTPQRGEYIPRFPEQERIIAGEFAREATTEFPGNVSTSTRVSVPPEIGNFRLIEEIGHGGMGVVLRAHDKKLKRNVAIKVLAPHLAADAEAVQRFLREAQSAAAVRHDNVVTIHAVDEANGIPFLVMELINGESLQDRLKRGPLPVDAIVQFGIQIALGLDAAHRRGLIHRDIKPANILLESHNESGKPDEVRVKITDFGLARVMSESAITRSGLIAGTPQYMSPEQANGKPLDHRSDLFSLGSVLYSLCTGQAAFHAESAIAVLRRVTDHEPEPIRAVNPTIPDWLCEVIAKLMAKQPEDRIQSAKEVADLLTRCQAPSHERRDGPTTAHTLPIVQSSPHDTSSLENSQTTVLLRVSSIAPQGSSRGPMTATLNRTLIAVALLAGVVLAVVFSLGRDPRPTDLDITATNPSERPQPEGVSHDAAKAPPRAIAPFNAEQAQQHQAAWAKYLGVPVEYTNSLGMKFRLIPPGEFTMGSTAEEIAAAVKDVSPDDMVILTQPIYLGVNEVTQAEYEKVMGVNPSHFAPMGMGKEAVAGLKTTEHPVEMVSWNDAAEFCAKLSKQENLEPFDSRAGETITPLDGTGYRLASEAEWEFACRAGTATKYWIGDKNEDLLRARWFKGNSGGRTHAAGELKANPFGLADIHGNVWEWVQDGWDATFDGQFQDNPAINPNIPFHACSQRVLRGGHWGDTASNCRSSNRLANVPTNRNLNLGFRVSLVVDTVKESREKQPAAPAPVEARSWHGWPADAPAPAIAPFNTKQAQHHQDLWAKYLGVPVEYTNSLGMKFRLIPPGEFTMGSTAAEIEEAATLVSKDKYWQACIKSEAPQHKVILTQPIYLGVNEVTQAEYEKVMGLNPSYFAPMGVGKGAVIGRETTSHPVEMVSWYDAAEFCAKLSKQEELKPFYFRAGETITPLDGTGYRLPSEAEWEFACRAGTATKWWTGDQYADLVRAGRFGGQSLSTTHPAGEFDANPFGLSDIHGNIWEWVQDSWDTTFYGQFQKKPAINPSSPYSAGPQRVIRGGRWNILPSHCRSSSRYADEPSTRKPHIGFRVVLVADAVKELLRKTKANAPPPAVAPFDEAQARAHQEKWAMHLGVPVEYENSIGMKFRLVPPGEFLMGITPEEIEAELKVATGLGVTWMREEIESEGPRHRVVLTKPNYVGVTEVTQLQYEQVMGINPSHFSATGEGKEAVANLETGNHPVEMVSWYDAAEFCAKLSQQEKRKPFYSRSGESVTALEGTGYRLPTEAEWEYACRAGTTTRYWCGDEDQDLIQADWSRSNSELRTHVVGELKANPFGLSDMHGNVWEWVQDDWDPAFYRQFLKDAAIDSSTPISSDSPRVVRGGRWMIAPCFSRSSSRTHDLPARRYDYTGFRVVLPVDAPRQAIKQSSNMDAKD